MLGSRRVGIRVFPILPLIPIEEEKELQFIEPWDYICAEYIVKHSETWEVGCYDQEIQHEEHWEV